MTAATEASSPSLPSSPTKNRLLNQNHNNNTNLTNNNHAAADNNTNGTGNSSKREEAAPLLLDFASKSVQINESFLKALSDEDSSFESVATICQQITQQQQNLASNNTTNILHDATFSNQMRLIWKHLLECLKQHNDRRCRCLAAHVLGITGRACYAQNRPSPLLYSQRETHLSSAVPDEICSDIATALVQHALLEEEDEGVNCAAWVALGHLLLSNDSSFGGLVQDDLLVHLNGIHTVSPYAPSLRSVVDEDPAVAWQEMQFRIYEQVVLPRLLHLLERVIFSASSNVVIAALPVLTASLVHAHDVQQAIVFAMDRNTYSKRWSEVDVTGLMDTCLNALILPSLSNDVSGNQALTGAFSALRLVHVCPDNNCTTSHICRAVASILQQQISACSAVDARTDLLMALIVALRGVDEDVGCVDGDDPSDAATAITIATTGRIYVADQVLQLPSTAVCPSHRSGIQVGASCRRPARMALWTELALLYFLDGSRRQVQQQQQSSQQAQQRPAQAQPRSGHSRILEATTALKVFFNSPSVAKLLRDSSNSTSVLNPRDELLLAFTSVAMEAGRRFRETADGTPMVVDPTCGAVREWLQLVIVVLSAFWNCASIPIPGAFLEENLSLLTAGLASYIQLLQEYLNFVGLLHPSSSVALKIGANALPPHVLWDRMTESAAWLSRFDSMDCTEEEYTASTKLMNELVNRELQHGIHSHQMRLFVLALSADHWVQARIAAIRKQFESSTNSTKADFLTLNVPSAREILRALAPKRLLAKIVEAHVPPVDSEGKPKRDPIKKLALETVRVSVACIENIALLACDWRRRFGSSQENKHIVSVAVGLLQGKVDETPVNEVMLAVLGPTCEAAVGRIQAFYENAGQGSDQSFPLSELVTQPVRIKIKPLVSSSKTNPRPKDDILREYLMQLCRQIVTSRIQLAIHSSPPADSMLSEARPVNLLRLAVPPSVPEFKDGRVYGSRGEAMASWGHSVRDASAASDPVQLIVAYTPRRYLRYDGEQVFGIAVIVKAFNMTPIDIVDGLRLEIGVAQSNEETEDSLSRDLVESMGGTMEDFSSNLPTSSASAVFKQELRSGEYFTWEVALKDVSSSSSLKLVPSIVYLNVPAEPESSGAKWVGEKPSEGEASTVGGESKSGEDDFQVTSSDAAKSFKGENAATESIRVVGQSLVLHPLVFLQPCSLVFYNDRCGDADSFRFLWFRFPYQLAPLKIHLESGQRSTGNINPTTKKIAKMSSLEWEGEAIPGGVATRLWAFMSYSGQRVYCVLTESENSNSNNQQCLYFRGDDQSLLCSVVGSRMSRELVVSSILPGMTA